LADIYGPAEDFIGKQREKNGLSLNPQQDLLTFQPNWRIRTRAVVLTDVHIKKTYKVAFTGRGYNMDYRTDFVIDIMKQKALRVLYDHRTASVAPLDN